jgi:hypothetical protein
MRMLSFSIAIAWLMAGTAFAGDCKTPAACTEAKACGVQNGCPHCGRPCEKTCRVVCEMKEVKKSCWVVKCKEFCAPMPGCGRDCGCGSCGEGNCAAQNCEAGCANHCGKCDLCAKEESKRIVPPKCGRVHEKKTLEKKEIVCHVPSYKCIVVYTCPNCGCGGSQECGGHQAPPPAPTGSKQPTLPPAPAPSKTTLSAPVPPSPDA